MSQRTDRVDALLRQEIGEMADRYHERSMALVSAIHDLVEAADCGFGELSGRGDR